MIVEQRYNIKEEIATIYERCIYVRCASFSCLYSQPFISAGSTAEDLTNHRLNILRKNSVLNVYCFVISLNSIVGQLFTEAL